MAIKPPYFLMVILLVVMIPAAALGTPAAQQGANFMVTVAGTAVGSIPHQIDLKVTQLPGGQLSEVTGFIVGPEDVVQVKQGENLIVSTSPDLKTNKVTVTNMQGIPIDLVPLPSNAWSLQGLLPGVYTLNVNVAMSSSGILGTYETILVILEPDQQPLPPTTIINQITVRQPDGGKEPSPQPPTSPTPCPTPSATPCPPSPQPPCPTPSATPCPPSPQPPSPQPPSPQPITPPITPPENGEESPENGEESPENGNGGDGGDGGDGGNGKFYS